MIVDRIREWERGLQRATRSLEGISPGSQANLPHTISAQRAASNLLREILNV